MRGTRLLSSSLGAVLLVGMVAKPPPASALSVCDLRYKVSVIEALSAPNTYTGIENINNRGEIAGYLFNTTNGSSSAFLMTRDREVIDLGDLGGELGAIAWDVHRGSVVGGSYTPDGSVHAFLWRREKGVMNDLGTLGGPNSVAVGINILGQIVGRADVSEDESHAFLKSPGNSRLRDLGTLGGPYSSASAIDNRGQVVGWSTISFEGRAEHAFLWSPVDRAMRDLGTLGGDFSYANALNDRGQVAGYSSTSDGVVHAFLWSGEPAMQDLGTLGGTESWATGINVWSQVVGSSNTRPDLDHPLNGPEHAFIWSKECGMRDLNTLTLNPPDGVALRSVFINDLGQMVAGDVFDEGSRWFWLKPVLWPWGAFEHAMEE